MQQTAGLRGFTLRATGTASPVAPGAAPAAAASAASSSAVSGRGFTLTSTAGEPKALALPPPLTEPPKLYFSQLSLPRLYEKARTDRDQKAAKRLTLVAGQASVPAVVGKEKERPSVAARVKNEMELWRRVQVPTIPLPGLENNETRAKFEEKLITNSRVPPYDFGELRRMSPAERRRRADIGMLKTLPPKLTDAQIANLSDDELREKAQERVRAEAEAKSREEKEKGDFKEILGHIPKEYPSVLLTSDPKYYATIGRALDPELRRALLLPWEVFNWTQFLQTYVSGDDPKVAKRQGVVLAAFRKPSNALVSEMGRKLDAGVPIPSFGTAGAAAGTFVSPRTRPRLNPK